MPVVVVYESMYGNTRAIAEAIAEGLNPADAVVVPVGQASPQVVTPADLVVVGGPTHMFGMSRPKSRQVAVDTACKPESGLTLEPEAQGAGLREWFDALDAPGGKAAAFDTRIKGPLLIGHASRGIRALLRQHRFELIAAPESFFVTKDNQLQAGELARARAWGQLLASRVPTAVTPHAEPSAEDRGEPAS